MVSVLNTQIKMTSNGGIAKIAIALVIAVMGLLLLTSISPDKVIPGGDDEIVTLDDSVQTFSSQEDLNAFIQYNAESGGTMQGSYGRGDMMMVEADFAMAEAAPTAAGAAKSSDDSATDFSTTNIQVEGVDEADIIKNDGKYIYVLSGNTLVIIDAYPAEDAEILSETELDGNAYDLFINGDKLVVFTTEYKYDDYNPYYYGSNTKTHILVYDVSDREDPDLEDEIRVDGDYFDSRMIGDYVYAIVNEPIYYRPCSNWYDYKIDFDCLTNDITVPEVLVNEVSIDKSFPDIHYWDVPDYSYRFTTVLAIDTDSGDVSKKIFVMGTSQVMFVSLKNIYVTRTSWLSYDDLMEQVYDEVIIPELPKDIQNDLEELEESDKSFNVKKLEKTLIIKEYLANLDKDELEEFEEAVADKMQNLEEDFRDNQERTAINKIAIRKDKITPSASGTVPGTVLNQFSMDEYDSYFRIATTTNRYGSEQANNLYVLDEELKRVGEVEDIAPGESIYSVRFMGKRAYMVTFKQVDPLFVIDLSDPTDPEILGKLKIPGYSDYLHPYDETHLIGIGKEVDESIDADKVHSDNAVYYTAIQGIKLAIFDVSDVEHPKEMYKEVIGDRGTESEATTEHKAFLFDKEKNLLVIPILLAEVADEYKKGDDWKKMEGDFTFQGAYVYDISLEDGFKLRGRVTHLDDEEELLKSGYYFRSPYSVKRSLYMDDILYTVSDMKIKMNNLDTIKDINEIELPYEGGGDYWGPYPMWEEGIVF